MTIASGSYTLAITDFDGSSAYADTGASLTMTALATYSNPILEHYTYFEATGVGAVLSFPALTKLGNFNTDSVLNVEATQGGRVAALTSINSTGDVVEDVDVEADGTGSVVNLSGLTELNVNSGTLTVTNDGAVLVRA